MNRREAELRALRSRAYGRNADIADDPAALRRLAALESREFEIIDQDAEDILAELQETSSPASAPAPHTAPPAMDDSDDPIGPDAAHGRSSPRLPRPGLFSPAPRPAWLVVGAVAVVAAAAGAGAFVLASQPAPEPPISAIILIDEDAGWPEALGEPLEGSAVFDDHLGLTFVKNPEWVMTGRVGESCLVAARTDELGADGSGAFRVACSAGSFPAVVQFTVDSDSPAALTDVYPEGTALQYTLRGNAIEVRVDE